MLRMLCGVVRCASVLCFCVPADYVFICSPVVVAHKVTGILRVLDSYEIEDTIDELDKEVMTLKCLTHPNLQSLISCIHPPENDTFIVRNQKNKKKKNLISITDLLISRKRCKVVTEFYDVGTLWDLLSRKPRLSEHVISAICKQVNPVLFFFFFFVTINLKFSKRFCLHLSSCTDIWQNTFPFQQGKSLLTR